MPVLTPDDYGGPIHRAQHACGCACTSCAQTDEKTYVPIHDPCDRTGASYTPITDSEYQCSLAVRIQSAIDAARRIDHKLGYKPYRVQLIWQERQADRSFKELRRLELTPVTMVTMNSLEVVASRWGESNLGGVALEGISPRQVNDDTLRGYIDGEDWVSKANGREFFYEITLINWCSTELKNKRRRFYPATEPNLEADTGQYQISLIQQSNDRGRDESDQVIGDQLNDGLPIPVGDGNPRLIA